MTIYLLAFLIAVVAGLRSLTAPAAVSWAASLGWLHLENTWLSWLGATPTPYILTTLALLELVTDKLSITPSRKKPGPFGFRLLSGALCGAAIGSARDALIVGLLVGLLGAVAGTLGGYEFRKRLVQAIGGKDVPIALLEDTIAVLGAGLIVYAAS
jgi:uncharacterized membrane protein